MSYFSNHSFAGQKALIRVDFNVPLDKETRAVTDDTRIKGAIPTLVKIIEDGGSVILMSHLGRPKEGPEEKSSLKHVIPALQLLIDKAIGHHINIDFANDCIGAEAIEKSAALQPGDILLLENLRFYKEEEKGDPAFAEKLSKLGDVYVNDAFGTAHRAHASTAVIAQYFPEGKKMFGLLMEGEVKAAEQVLLKAEKPFTAIIGGDKVSDKILIIENLL
ncbi:MAG: phosphoglycerate kinase, partial [Sediminibacterium sp.]